MHTIKKILLYQYRNYGGAEFHFKAPVTCISGPNGSGKTNLLDAVYYLCYTKSYFSALHQNAVLFGTEGFRIEGFFEKGSKTEIIACKWKQGKKELFADGQEYEKVNDHIGKYAAVMIAPDDILLINEGSDARRKWMDGILSQVDKIYLETLVHYHKLLQQRNAWLKMQAQKYNKDFRELEFYDAELAKDAAYLNDCRKHFVQAIGPVLKALYEKLSASKEVVEIVYESDLNHHSMAHLLKDSLQQDLHMQRTLKGVHRDDLIFVLNTKPVKTFGSQGQKKSFLFALKLAQFKYLKNKLNYLPILLLDDIFEKLDQQRIEALLGIIKNFGQVILTDTHAERISEAFGPDAAINFIKLA